MIFIQPNNPNASAAFVKPRSTTAEADSVTAADLETPASPLEEKETADTFTLTKKPQETETDNTISPQREEKTADNVTDNKKAVKTDSPHSSKKTKEHKKALAKALKDAEKQERLDNQEIHDAKIKTAWWTCFPVIGPLLGVLPNLFSSPEANASKRLDVTIKDRPEDEAIEHEKKIKGAKLKAAFLVSIPHIIGDVLFVLATINSIKNPEKYVENLTKNMPLEMAKFWGATVVTLAMALGYQFFEKTDDPNFNKGL
ncbi:MAG: hypothetical protein NTW61_07940 [Candidatus Melainabacteria bacterium]|nr:hypothetical protein [Candidatus Melainabacteria bacterium]